MRHNAAVAAAVSAIMSEAAIELQELAEDSRNLSPLLFREAVQSVACAAAYLVHAKVQELQIEVPS